MVAKILISYFLSNLLIIVYDAIYKALKPLDIMHHKLYLDGSLSDIIIQLLLSSFFSIVRAFSILKGINKYRIKLFLKALIQISFGCLVYNFI